MRRFSSGNNNGDYTERQDKIATWEPAELVAWLEEKAADGNKENQFIKGDEFRPVLDFFRNSILQQDVKEFVEMIKVGKTWTKPLSGDKRGKKNITMKKIWTSKLHGLMTQQDKTPSPKTYNDNVHGPVTLHPVVHAIIREPEFARMRKILQLGGAKYIFPGAIHSRHQHSIGTMIVTERYLEGIFKAHPEYRNLFEITDKDIICLLVAALCHDLGHAALSHFWDGHFIKKKLPIKDPYSDKVYTEWNHEMASKLLLDVIFSRKDVIEVMALYDLDDVDKVFIKELIDPDELKGLKPTDDWPMKGRPESKAFLYEFVSNKRDGLDTDKMDYLIRDQKNALGKDPTPSYQRIFINTAVGFEEGREERTMLMYDEKLLQERTWQEFYSLRLRGHSQIYQHHQNCAVEAMFGDVLTYVQDYFKVEGKDGKMYKLHEAIHDMEAYIKCTDRIFDLIEHGHGLEQARKEHGEEAAIAWKKAQDLLKRIESEQWYTCMGQTLQNSEIDQKIIDDIKKLVIEFANKKLHNNKSNIELEIDDLVQTTQRLDWGMKDENPIEFIPIKKSGNVYPTYSKDKSKLDPEKFNEHHLRLFCKVREAKNEASGAFKDVCEIKNLEFKGGQGKDK